MTQNTLSHSAISLEQLIKAGGKPCQSTSQPRGPFTVSRVGNQPVAKHQVSTTSHWTNAEKERYSLFVCYFRQLLNEDKSSTNNWNLFKGMSKFVKTRNPQQCRSHHLKLIKEFSGISRFIMMVMERVPRLKERILLTESELSQIQIQFNLYLPESRIGDLSAINENRLFHQEEEPQQATGQHAQCKKEKQEFIKTADSYIQQRHPVNFGSGGFSIFSSRSEFKPFDQLRTKPNRSSLPSFGEEEDPAQEIKQEERSVRSQVLPDQKIQASSHSQESHLASSQENFSVFSNSFDLLRSEDKGMEKMKEFLQCHFLFQLWTSKLEKIMRDS